MLTDYSENQMKTIDINDQDALNFIGELEGADFVSPSTTTKQVIKKFANKTLIGEFLPWSETNKEIQFRPCEVSLWGGYNGSGKSQLLGQIAAWNLSQSIWAIASLEMPYLQSHIRMLRQVSASRIPSDEFIYEFNNWADNKLWYYDRLDSVPSQVMLGIIIYAASELKVNHFIIDSLVKCRIGREDYDKQMQFVEKLSAIAKQYKIHIHLVHHMRKKENEEVMPTKFDFRGAGEITDLVDNCFIFFRNKKKERLLRQNKHTEETHNQFDQFLKCEKQRYGEWEGIKGLWFHQDSLQYTSRQNQTMLYNRLQLKNESIK